MAQLGRFWHWFSVWLILTAARLFAIVLLLIGLVIGVLGYHSQYGLDFGELGARLLRDYSANLTTELLSIAVTVLVIDWLNEQRAKREAKEREGLADQEAKQRLKQQLIREMGNTPNVFALRAVAELDAPWRGWLKDGSLQKAQLPEASLDRANLQGADLQEANLQGAKLRRAKLQRAKLQGANLKGAQLQGAVLSGGNGILERPVIGPTEADLTGADLTGANLQGATITDKQLRVTKSLTAAIMPDGRKYEDWLKGRSA